MSLDNIINTYLKARYENEICENCHDDEACRDGLCIGCYENREISRMEAIREAYD